MIGVAILIVLAGASGCWQAAESPETPPDIFTATYTLENGRNYSISIASNGKPGEQSEYIPGINNISDTLAIPYDEVKMPELPLREYELDQSFIDYTIRRSTPQIGE